MIKTFLSSRKGYDLQQSQCSHVLERKYVLITGNCFQEADADSIEAGEFCNNVMIEAIDETMFKEPGRMKLSRSVLDHFCC